MAPKPDYDVKKHVLVVPLDWGLGHATRCIPVIRQLQAVGARVSIGAEGAAARLLAAEFPDLEMIPLQGYRIRYSRSGFLLFFRLLQQLPGLFKSIRREHQWLERTVQHHRIDAVISDNRFGLYHAGVPTVFITHQLQIQSPFIFRRLIRWLNYNFINRYTFCWVPDQEGAVNLAGGLSHPRSMPRTPVTYTGPMSRLRKSRSVPTKHHLFVSLSGPEPQRTLLEEKIIDQLSHYNFTATVVRGLPNEERRIPSTNSLKFYNHLNAAAYADEIEKAELVITRSGYSTVMDLARMDKRAVLIPTPGQTEQEYLGSYLNKKGMALSVSQKEFNLQQVLKLADSFPFKWPATGESGLQSAVDALFRVMR